APAAPAIGPSGVDAAAPAITKSAHTASNIASNTTNATAASSRASSRPPESSATSTSAQCISSLPPLAAGGRLEQRRHLTHAHDARATTSAGGVAGHQTRDFARQLQHGYAQQQ